MLKKTKSADGGIVIRVDGSRTLGLGHIVRCVSLADAITKELETRNLILSVEFVVRQEEGLSQIFDESGCSFEWIKSEDMSQDISVFSELLRLKNPGLVIFDINIQNEFEKYVEAVPSDTIIASIHEHNYSVLTRDLVFAPTVKRMELPFGGIAGQSHFSGAEYVILSPDILLLRKNVKQPEPKILNGIVSIGGSDPGSITLKVIEQLKADDVSGIIWNIVFGPASELESSESRERFIFHQGAKLGRKGFLELLANADIAITNGGTTLYEALSLRKPTIGIAQNDFEKDVIIALEAEGACLGVNINNAELSEKLRILLTDFQLRKSISEKGAKIIDGEGGKRIAKILVSRLIDSIF